MIRVASLFVLSAVSGAVILLSFQRWSDQQAIRRSTNLIIARLFEFRLFLDEPALILRAQRALIAENLRLLGLLLRPMLIVTIPMLALFEPMDAIYGHVPLPVFEPAVVTAKLKTTGDAQLRTPNGFAIETPAVHIPSAHEVSWRIRPIGPETGFVQVNGASKPITAGAPVLAYLPDRTRFWLDPDVEWIEVRYPRANILGLQWAVWFFLVSSASTVLLMSLQSKWPWRSARPFAAAK